MAIGAQKRKERKKQQKRGSMREKCKRKKQMPPLKCQASHTNGAGS
jgi:hypothetical protein